MPELPDVELYLHALRPRVVGAVLERVRVMSPSLVRTFDPPLSDVHGRCVTGVSRIGKRIVFELDDDRFLVVHLMITGRFQWKAKGVKIPRKRAHCAFDFDRGSLLLTEQSTRKRASLHLVVGREALLAHDPGGVDPLQLDLDAFRSVLARERRTLKRALTDPRLLSGIGNAYSDELLHRARLSPTRRTDQLDDEEWERLHAATLSTLTEWRNRLIAEHGDRWPTKVTAFRPGMAVHGRFKEPCPDCGAPVQRIVYAERELNYCAKCQTGGRLLKDRALSRLLKEDWPERLLD